MNKITAAPVTDKEAMLSREQLLNTLRYIPETGDFIRLMKTSSRAVTGLLNPRPNHKGYLPLRLNGKIYLLHRLAWFYSYGVWPTGQLDHIDGNPANNKLSNLRDVSSQENSWNRRRPSHHNSTGYLGVARVKYKGTSPDRFKAAVVINGVRTRIGTYLTPEEAHENYVKVKRQLHSTCTL